MSLYMYATGSPFEVLVNNYMITAQAVHPPDTSNIVNLNGTLTNSTTNGLFEPLSVGVANLLGTYQ